MKHDGLLEHGRYYIHVFTEPVQEGWLAWASFERTKDFEQQMTLIRSVKHRLPDVFASREQAAAAARDYSVKTIDADGVGL